MKTVLYIVSTDDEVMTLDEIRARYMKENNSELPISDNEMQLIILSKLTVTHGDINSYPWWRVQSSSE